MEALEKAVEVAEDINARIDARNPELRKAADEVERFLKANRLLCYGGTALNDLLPPAQQFYDPETTLPDYDLYSETPQLHAMEIADALKRAGITRIEVRPGVHLGTFKVFANYTGVADITELPKEVFRKLWDEKVERHGVHYVSPNFLRMSIYLELSRPRGDVARWTKIYKRLELLNEAYPIECPKSASEGRALEHTRGLEHFLARHTIVVLGLHASQLHERKVRPWDLPIDLLTTPKQRKALSKKLADVLGDVRLQEHDAVGEILPAHTDLFRGKRLMARVFEAQACHSYHRTREGIRVASIPTILQFLFGYLYAEDLEGLDPNRLLCVAQRLVDLAHNEHRSRRFKFLTPLDCLGTQESLVDIRTHTAELRQSMPKGSREFLKTFFTYNPRETTPSQRRTLRKALGARKRTQRKDRWRFF